MAKQQKRPASQDQSSRPRAQARPGGARLFWVPFGLTIALVLLSFLPRVQSNIVLARSFWGAAVALILWLAVLRLRCPKHASWPSFVPVPPRPQHYVQAMCHISVYTYWGWYWAPVPNYVWLLVAQLVFAYAFDMLLSWSRRDRKSVV